MQGGEKATEAEAVCMSAFVCALLVKQSVRTTACYILWPCMMQAGLCFA